MRAPVYRNIEADNTFLGLAFPTELLLVLFAYWLYLNTLPPWVGILAGMATYALVRMVGRRRGPMFLQHWLVFSARQAWTEGRLSAAARAPAPRFPFARYDWRDVPCREPSPVSRAAGEGVLDWLGPGRALTPENER